MVPRLRILYTFLDILDNFVHPRIYTDKSTVVVFNSNENTFLYTFKCANYTLETVNSYCNLGITFKQSGYLILGVHSKLQMIQN